MNLFLEDTATNSLRLQLQIHFSKRQHANNSTGPFTDNGLTGMLEVPHLEKVDQMSPFPGGIADLFLGNERCAEITKVFSSFCNV